jgi:hypothetical protein
VLVAIFAGLSVNPGVALDDPDRMCYRLVAIFLNHPP